MKPRIFEERRSQPTREADHRNAPREELDLIDDLQERYQESRDESEVIWDKFLSGG